MTVITRFAPSPTGLLHIGGARTALFNYLFARHHNGQFLLRVEDTDKKRSTMEATQAILDGLNWLGLKYDQKPFYQSGHENRHKEIALKLLEKGQAYECYVSAEELLNSRQEAEKNGKVFRFQSPWRDSNLDAPNGVKPVIRIKSPKDGFTIINDLVQGEVKVANSELDDMIILRSDGTPTYNLAVVVDDFDMGITHVIRGDDHLNNAFRQKIIYEAMGWKVPEFAHIPLIHGADGAKMSKRHGATNVMDYQEMGYLPEALRNYLLRLGWSHGDDEIISDSDAIKWFDFDKVGRSPSRFDFDKLNNLNKYYIKQKTALELLELIRPRFRRNDLADNQNKVLAALEFLKEKANDLNHLTDLAEDFFEFSESELKHKFEKPETKKLLSEKKDLAKKLLELINNVSTWNSHEIENSFKEKNLQIKDFGPVIRSILVAQGKIFDIIEILGKKEVQKRFEFALKQTN